MAFKLPETVDAITGMCSIFAVTSATMLFAALGILFTEPEKSLDPVQYFILTAIPVVFTVLTFWSYKQDQKRNNS